MKVLISCLLADSLARCRRGRTYPVYQRYKHASVARLTYEVLSTPKEGI